MPTKSIPARQFRIDNNLPVKKPMPKPKRQPGTPRNKWEQDMFNLLTALVKAKVINEFFYEPFAFTMLEKPKCSYKPDFTISTLDGGLIILEVKGYQREKDKIRFLWAGSMNTSYRFVMLTKDKGKWVVKFDLNKGSAELPKEIVND